ncbi:MAG: hypothetical protein QXO40_05430 [Candidatus Aenigmatarchaeota archaeon]
MNKVLKKFREIEEIFYSCMYSYEEENDIEGCLNGINLMINELNALKELINGENKE